MTHFFTADELCHLYYSQKAGKSNKELMYSMKSSATQIHNASRDLNTLLSGAQIDRVKNLHAYQQAALRIKTATGGKPPQEAPQPTNGAVATTTSSNDLTALRQRIHASIDAYLDKASQAEAELILKETMKQMVKR